MLELNQSGNSRVGEVADLVNIPIEEAFPNVDKEIYNTKSGIVLAKLDSLYILQEDVILSPDQVALLDEQPTRGAFMTGITSYWDFCKVYYDFAPNYSYQEQALQAMANISAVTGVEFRPKTASTKNYVRFIHSNGNYFSLGKVGGKQDLSVATSQSSITGITMHELLHALGVFHEMARPDRDTFVEVLWNNIESNDKKHNFKTYSERKISGALVGTFNFSSIMMYSSTDFGKRVNGIRQETIRRKDGQPYYTQRSYLADTDIAAVRAIYGPPYVNVERDIDVIDDYDDGYDRYYRAYYPTNAVFYKDKKFTVRDTLKSPRYLIIEKYGNRFIATYSMMVVPAGISSCLIGTGYRDDSERWGQGAESTSTEYSIVNCHGNGY